MEHNEVNTENGFSWPLEDLPASKKSEDLEEALAFGNHKGAESNPKILKQLVEKDVTFGYGLVLPLEESNNVPDVLLALMNIMKHTSIDEPGKIIKKGQTDP